MERSLSTSAGVRRTRLGKWQIQSAQSRPENSKYGRSRWKAADSRACWVIWDAAKRTAKTFRSHPTGNTQCGQRRNSFGLQILKRARRDKRRGRHRDRHRGSLKKQRPNNFSSRGGRIVNPSGRRTVEQLLL